MIPLNYMRKQNIIINQQLRLFRCADWHGILASSQWLLCAIVRPHGDIEVVARDHGWYDLFDRRASLWPASSQALPPIQTIHIWSSLCASVRYTELISTLFFFLILLGGSLWRCEWLDACLVSFFGFIYQNQPITERLMQEFIFEHHSDDKFSECLTCAECTPYGAAMDMATDEKSAHKI